MNRFSAGLLALTLVAGAVQAELVTFRIDSLTSNNAVLREVVASTGDDRGGIALGSNGVLLTGDNTTGVFNRTTLATSGSAARNDGIFANLANQKLYALGTSATTPINAFSSGNVTITHLIELNAAGASTGSSIALSSSISVNGSCCSPNGQGVFAGWDSVLIRSQSGAVSKINLATGGVTALGAVGGVNLMSSESWASWGVAEYFGGEDYLTYAGLWGTGNILRTRVSDGQTSTVANFGSYGLSDLANFTVSATDSRWYFHYEGRATAFGFGSDETLGYADARFTVVTGSTVPEPTSLALFGAALAGLGFCRRKTTQA